MEIITEYDCQHIMCPRCNHEVLLGVEFDLYNHISCRCGWNGDVIYPILHDVEDHPEFIEKADFCIEIKELPIIPTPQEETIPRLPTPKYIRMATTKNIVDEMKKRGYNIENNNR